jgi:ABC-2 type transport system ATP-binding protein
MTPILSLSHVVKAYQSTVAVDDVSFDIPRGSIFGLLGPNGAGKTSLIRIITSITRADSGEVRIDGEPLHSNHPEVIGYMPEERGLYKKMKVGEHLIYLARLKGLSAGDAKASIDHWMTKFDITDWYNKKVEELSKGMQQKIQFIATIIHRPSLIILDEPFSGLDPINANLIKDEIYQLKEQGASIIFSTHRMEQVEEICERIVLINRGRNVLEGQVADIRQERKQNLFRFAYKGDLPRDLLEKQDILHQEPGLLTLHFEQDRDSNTFLRRLIDQGVYVSDFTEILPSINEVFIQTVAAQEVAIEDAQNTKA